MNPDHSISRRNPVALCLAGLLALLSATAPFGGAAAQSVIPIPAAAPEGAAEADPAQASETGPATPAVIPVPAAAAVTPEPAAPAQLPVPEAPNPDGMAPAVATAAAAAPEAAEPAEPADPVPPKPLKPVAALWPLNLNRLDGTMAKLQGEHDSLQFSLFVPETGTPSELHIGAVSSAFIKPGRSILHAYIGDVLVGEMPLESITTVESTSFSVPDGLLKPGFNLVRIEVDLAHRLYCGAVESYDLWTQIDLGRSGIEFDPADLPAGAASFLTAASAARGAGRPLLVSAGSGIDPNSDEFRQIASQFGAVMGGGVGFATGQGVPVAGGLPVPVVEVAASTTPEVTYRVAEDGTQIMKVGIGADAVPTLFDIDGVLASRPVLTEIPRDVEVPLSRLGFSTVRITQHLWQETVPFRLPDDWLINVKERATLFLDFSYLPAMVEGSELRLQINGEVVRIIPLEKEGRLGQIPLEVRFDAGRLQSGRNALSFELNLPGDPPDEPCLTASVERLEIRDTSYLVVPSSPKMHMPGLARWMSGSDTPLVLASATSVDVAGNVSLDSTADWAFNAGLSAALQAGVGGEHTGHVEDRRVTVLRPDQLSRNAFGDFGIGRQVVLASLRSPREEPGAAPVLAAANAAPVDQGLSLSMPALTQEGRFDELQARLGALFGQLWQSLAQIAAPDPVTDLTTWLSGNHAQALLLQLDPTRPDDLFVVLSETADPADVLAAIGGVTRNGVPLRGHVALLDWDGAWSTWTDTSRMPVLEEPVNETNWRGIAGNFASARPDLFVGALMLMVLLSVIVANSYIAASRKRK